MRKETELSSEKKNLKVCHMTDAHVQEDIRIFHKECISLARHGFDIYQVSRGKKYEKDDVHLIGIGEISGNRLLRMTRAAKKVYQAAKDLDADIYHIHDPELLPYGLKLKVQGKKVIFDSHEDVPAQIMDKAWIPVFLRKAVSALYRLYETRVVKRLDAVIAATPYIAKQFQKRAKKVVVVNNYPKLDDIQFHDKPFQQRERIVCYAGGINENRGEKVMIEAMKGVDGVLILAGKHEKKVISNSVASGGGVLENRKIVEYVGNLSRAEVDKLYGKSRVGIMIYQPIANHVKASPNKLYEFMAAGLPVLISNFPMWQKFVEENRCGFCVDPLNVEEVRALCQYMLNHPEECQEMGRNGRFAVEEKYNWEKEENALIGLYNEMAVL